jgi:hypothetical protein
MGKRKQNRTSGRPQIIEHLKQASVRWAARAVVAGLALAAFWFGARKIWAAIAQRPDFTVRASGLSFKTCPPCVQADAMTVLLRHFLESTVEGASVFSRELCETVQEDLRSCPWVLEVKGVRRLMPNKLQVDIVFREPAASVEAGGKRYVIDAGGYWLPDWLYRFPSEWNAQTMPVIVDRKLSSAPPLGKSWGSASLVAGAQLNAFLMKQGLYQDLPMAVIDATHVGRGSTEPDIVLVARNGAVITWGDSDSYAHLRKAKGLASGNDDATKLAMLKSKLSEYPRLEGLEYVDLRFSKIFFRPIASVGVQSRNTGSKAR